MIIDALVDCPIEVAKSRIPFRVNTALKTPEINRVDLLRKADRLRGPQGGSPAGLKSQSLDD